MLRRGRECSRAAHVPHEQIIQKLHHCPKDILFLYGIKSLALLRHSSTLLLQGYNDCDRALQFRISQSVSCQVSILTKKTTTH